MVLVYDSICHMHQAKLLSIAKHLKSITDVFGAKPDSNPPPDCFRSDPAFMARIKSMFPNLYHIKSHAYIYTYWVFVRISFSLVKYGHLGNVKKWICGRTGFFLRPFLLPAPNIGLVPRPQGRRPKNLRSCRSMPANSCAGHLAIFTWAPAGCL